MSPRAQSRASGAHLFPNLGAEEGSARERATRGDAPQTVRRLWRLLFAAQTQEIGAAAPAPWPECLGPPPREPAFAGLENDGGMVPWLSTPEAVDRAREFGLDCRAADPQAVARVHDKAFAQRLALREAAVPGCLRDCLHVFEPEDLAEPQGALRALDRQLRKWPAWAPDSFVLKPRYGCNGRGRVDGRVGSLDAPALRGSLRRLVARGGAVLEPWLDRRGDFSVQWFVAPDSQTRMLGSLEQVASPAGVCRGHRGCVDSRGRVSSGRPADEAMREASMVAAQAARQAGYRGPLGVDGFAFAGPDDAQPELLRPIVEINARFTVGCIALGLVRRALQVHRKALGLEPGVQRNFYLGLDAPRGGWDRAREAAGDFSLLLRLGGEPGGASPGLLFTASKESLDAALAAATGDEGAVV